MVTRSRLTSWRGSAIAITVSVAIVVLCWILGNPRSAGPDEPAHMVASAGLVRGDRDGRPNPDPNAPGTRLFDVPGMVGAPDPSCWTSGVQFDPNIPAACENSQPLSTATQAMSSSSYNYPPWAFLLPGLASFVPSAGGYAYLARLLNAVVAIALVSISLTVLARRRRLDAAALLLGLTPIAWFTFGVVNPSATAIGGGVALWTALLHRRGRRLDWLAVAGWGAVLLARRDGAVWATLTVLVCCWVLRTRPSALSASFGKAARWASLALALLCPITPLINGERGFNLALSLAPLSIVAVELLLRGADRIASEAARRVYWWYTGGAALLLAALAATMRPGGFKLHTFRLIVWNTSRHLRQLVGELGWLSAPVPTIAVMAFWATIGVLVGVALLEHRQAATTYLAALGAAVVTAWMLELGQGADYGQYWQGRYTMPFAVGLPLLLVWRPEGWSPARMRSLTTPIAWVAWVVWAILNIAFVAAQHRWGVGVNGSWSPSDWDNWGAPVQPVVLVVVHAVVSGFLLLATNAVDRVEQ
jgi:hypothetical protein